MNASDQRWYAELAASRSAHQGSSMDAGGNLLPTSAADEVDMFFPALADSASSNSRARQYYQQVHAAQMHSAYSSAAASHGNHQEAPHY